MPIVHRYDTIDCPTWMTAPFVKTPEGFLKGQACITSIGVFPYLQSDGSIVQELRLPEEVFSDESLESYKLKPVTNDHPGEKVTAENIKKYQVGNLGENPYNRDGVFLSIDMIIQDAATIADIMAGKRALSVGYDAEIDVSPGIIGGVKYDCIQRKIRTNHVAVVDRARQGDQARIRLDSNDAILVNGNSKEDTRMPDMKKIRIDGVEYEGEAKVVESYNLATQKCDALQKDLEVVKSDKTKIEAERDTLKDSLEKANTKVKELEASRIDEKAVEVAVARRVRILDAATKAGIEIKDMKESDIQKAVVMKGFPKIVFDGKDQLYIDTCFEIALGQLDDADNADAESRKINADKLDNTDSSGEAPNAEKARLAYSARLTSKDKK
jgi:hypothetical protein